MGRFFSLKRTFLLSLILLALAVAQQRQNTTSGTDIIGEEDARRMSEEQQERQRQQAEARKRRRQREKEREGQLAAKQTLQLASSEACDWKSSPLALVKGHICGVH